MGHTVDCLNGATGHGSTWCNCWCHTNPPPISAPTPIHKVDTKTPDEVVFGTISRNALASIKFEIDRMVKNGYCTDAQMRRVKIEVNLLYERIISTEGR